MRGGLTALAGFASGCVRYVPVDSDSLTGLPATKLPRQPFLAPDLPNYPTETKDVSKNVYELFSILMKQDSRIIEDSGNIVAWTTFGNQIENCVYHARAIHYPTGKKSLDVVTGTAKPGRYELHLSDGIQGDFDGKIDGAYRFEYDVFGGFSLNATPILDEFNLIYHRVVDELIDILKNDDVPRLRRKIDLKKRQIWV